MDDQLWDLLQLIADLHAGDDGEDLSGALSAIAAVLAAVGGGLAIVGAVSSAPAWVVAAGVAGVFSGLLWLGSEVAEKIGPEAKAKADRLRDLVSVRNWRMDPAVRDEAVGLAQELYQDVQDWAASQRGTRERQRPPELPQPDLMGKAMPPHPAVPDLQELLRPPQQVEPLRLVELLRTELPGLLTNELMGRELPVNGRDLQWYLQRRDCNS